MTPAEVPDELVEAAKPALRELLATEGVFAAADHPRFDFVARRILAAVLPLYGATLLEEAATEVRSEADKADLANDEWKRAWNICDLPRCIRTALDRRTTAGRRDREDELMGAREELAAIRERAEAALRSDDWGDANREREALSDAVYESLELVDALEAVLETADEWAASPAVGASSEEQWELDTLRNAARSLHEDLAALTTDTKGGDRG